MISCVDEWCTTETAWLHIQVGRSVTSVTQWSLNLGSGSDHWILFRQWSLNLGSGSSQWIWTHLRVYIGFRHNADKRAILFMVGELVMWLDHLPQFALCRLVSFVMDSTPGGGLSRDWVLDGYFPCMWMFNNGEHQTTCVPPWIR